MPLLSRDTVQAADMQNEFEQAADDIITGNAPALTFHLQTNPDLVGARSERQHRATLLHYLSANGVETERQRTPQNALSIAAILLDAGAEVDAVADLYGKSTTLGLVATSIHPKNASVQISLMRVLLQHGAAVDGVPGERSIVTAALHNGHKQSAEFLAKHGAGLDLEGAAGVGRLSVVQSFLNADRSLRSTATAEQMQLGFLWACEYGRTDVAAFLLDRGVDMHAQAGTGLTALHWAVVGAQLDVIKLLLDRGASLEEKNAHGGTALGQALWSASNCDPAVDYAPVVEMLLRAGAQAHEFMG